MSQTCCHPCPFATEQEQTNVILYKISLRAQVSRGSFTFIHAETQRQKKHSTLPTRYEVKIHTIKPWIIDLEKMMTQNMMSQGMTLELLLFRQCKF